MKQPGDFEGRIGKSVKSSIDAQQNLLNDFKTIAEIATACSTIVAAFQQGNKLLLFGNGGSAADAQHIAAEFVGRFAFNRAALPAIALGVNGSCLTAIGNDYGFDQAFSRQIEALGRAGDVAVGISTSGNSPNVLQGLTAAKKMGLRTIVLTGKTGGKLTGSENVDSCICAPTDETARIQECHILIGHVICEMVEQELFG
ncbi:MAG TPA: D-sedoheptulose 7-phosphate isomerase [Candidatus Acidoferrum sp.]|jgi:D-sedoheptulose 7-phosphate isomerase